MKDGIIDFLMNEEYSWSPLVSPRLSDMFRYILSYSYLRVMLQQSESFYILETSSAGLEHGTKAREQYLIIAILEKMDLLFLMARSTHQKKNATKYGQHQRNTVI